MKQSRSPVAKTAAPKQIRAAVYCRKSTEHGLGQEFNSIDAQREACEAYVATMKHAGWVCLPEHYSDGGWSGGNTERPALQRLLGDVEAGNIDAVVVHRIDRLSRSLLDFTQMLTTFERRGVSFASVTQSFDTASSMGRLTMHILSSFSEFERSMISERIRDKISAQRRRGMWCGGRPVLGYEVDRSGLSPRLVVNEDEATRVRAIFALYLELGGLMAVVEELRRRGWCAKSWTTKAGTQRGGQPFDKANLHLLLTNPIVAGKIVHKGAVHDGLHEAIINAAVFAKVQSRLAANCRAKSAFGMASATGALLRGLLRCKACDSAMVHTMCKRKSRVYRYYACARGARHGAASCPSGSLPGAEIERFVIEQVKAVLQRPEFARAALKEAKLIAADPAIDIASIRAAIDDIDGLWPTLSPSEQYQLVHLLLERVEYDAGTSSIALSFRDGVVAGHIPRSTEVVAKPATRTSTAEAAA